MSVRILIDCASISVRSHITGIPRVVLKYIEQGYRYGRQHEIDVVPVYVTRKGVIDARYNLPGWAQDAPGFDAPHRGSSTIARSEVLRRIQRRESFVRRFIAPVIRTLSARLHSVGVGGFVEWLRTAYRQSTYERALKMGVSRKIPLRPGDVLFMPAYWHDEPPEVYRRAGDGAFIVPLLHDVLPVTLPDGYNKGWRDMFRRHLIEVAQLCKHIMYVSATTRDDFLRVLSSAKIPEPPHSVHHHGSDYLLLGAAEAPNATPVSEEIRRFFSEPGFHLLMVGTLEPKKNHLMVLSACRTLWERGVEFKLAIIGRAGWQSDAIDGRISAALRNRAWGKNLAWFAEASDTDLEFAYSNSQLCVLASGGEGFGLPLIEALEHEVPVLASDIPIFHEIGGDHVDFFDLDVPGALASALEKLIADPAHYNEARGRASSFKWPNWETVCDQAFDTLCEIARSG